MTSICQSLFLLVAFSASWGLHAQCNRQAIVDDYNTNFLGSAVSFAELGWTGNADSCMAGDISPLAQQRTLDRINYFRRLCGVSDNIIFRSDLDSMCREAALMMRAEGRLSHSPDTNWACFSQAGYRGAASSNLSSGSYASNAIVSYMRDFGSGNVAVGHRRWILYSRASIFGHGSTSSTSALWVIGNRVSPPAIDFVAYPAAGFFPAPLVFPRWSFSVPGADFTNASISMTDPAGNAIPLSIIHTNGGYGDRTIVWEPDMSQIDLSNPIDQLFHIEIADVAGSGSASYAYDVAIIQPVHPPACVPGDRWEEDSCKCISPNTAIAGVLSREQLKIHVDQDQLHLHFPQGYAGTTSLKIMDLGGKCIYQENWERIGPGFQTSVSTQHLPTGIYAIEVRQGSDRKILKMVK